MTNRSFPKQRTNVDEFATISVSADDIESARRLLSVLAQVDECSHEQTEASSHSPKFFRHRARDILANRRRRHDIFGKAMFGEPAWDMLLLLYVTEGEARQSISRLGELSGASKTTALRWLDYLEGQRLIQRETHPTDKRTIFVELSDKGRTAIEAYLSETVPPND